jgi:16S rRNA (cytidine1402-2'-O)-methyltransferase
VKSEHPNATGTLYVVAMPIGNAADLSPRAIATLRQADLIACEDTRRMGVVLAAHGIGTPAVSYFEHNEARRTGGLVERLLGGENIALATDAGTPAISDPGFRLVRAALEAGVRVAAVPGPSAVLAALSIAGIATDRFTFEGFLPVRDAARRAALGRLAREPRTMVFFEAARRLADTLDAMAAVFGGDRDGAVVREATKVHEETVRGTLGGLAARFREHRALGEVTIVVAGTGADAGEDAEGAFKLVTIDALLDAGLKLKEASAILARLTGRSRREIYQQALKSRGGGDS